AIVNTCSSLGLIAGAGISAYVASKHGVAGLTKTAALEYATQGIRVNAVCPGSIETNFAKALSPEFREFLVASHPIGRFGEPDEVASAVVWLCSDEASFVTAAMLSVDG